MYLGLYKPNIVPFILFISITVGICATITGAIVRDLPAPERESAESSRNIQKVFGIGYALTALLSVLLVGSATAIQFVPGADSHGWRIGLTVATFVLFFGIVAFLFVQRDPAGQGSVQGEGLQQSLLAKEASPATLREYTMLESMATLDFWILFVAFFFSSGAGLIIINNLGQLVPAVGGQEGDVGTCAPQSTDPIPAAVLTAVPGRRCIDPQCVQLRGAAGLRRRWGLGADQAPHPTAGGVRLVHLDDGGGDAAARDWKRAGVVRRHHRRGNFLRSAQR